MKRISLLIHEDVYSSAIGGVIDLFDGANWCLEQSGKPPAFRLELVHYTTIDKVVTTDLIIIPGFKGERSDRIITDQDGIYTSGGAFSALKLILYLIENFCG